VIGRTDDDDGYPIGHLHNLCKNVLRVHTDVSAGFFGVTSTIMAFHFKFSTNFCINYASGHAACTRIITFLWQQLAFRFWNVIKKLYTH